MECNSGNPKFGSLQGSLKGLRSLVYFAFVASLSLISLAWFSPQIIIVEASTALGVSTQASRADVHHP
jgi:hypothetical protein